ncbi:GNAT family N-acetyltransferase [Sediminicoccus sp. KRV36]|uniref:GNAT family N-acetyltransferase n=1 Tax=Sediminicoccus sp. KRV36 TaxID=3133721 RepID=UPI00200E56D5|nr:GNAT family N-acetyltransferase [Sediminicoccus rosea]UPY38111.1 GNAT family N-acetyltransferase [Sediminicoccus rosea]
MIRPSLMKLVEPTTRIAVDVTFLRMDKRPADPGAPLPEGLVVEQLFPRCGVPLYRELYATVGHEYVWWLRRTLSDRDLDALLSDRAISIHVLRDAEGILGFYELDRRGWPIMNLAYFGLYPRGMGGGIGMALLRHAIAAAWKEEPAALTVNTCTADHPRALPNYLKAGFHKLRTVREEWPVPDRLGLPIPERLKI